MRDASAASLILDDFGGDERTRTADPLLAKQVLYQLSYVPSGDARNVAKNVPRLQHPLDIESIEHAIAAEPVASAAQARSGRA
jgi:hypothetical protein